ncbi:hypothetical protein PUR28_16050 [Streptomyces sp. BE308]|uniref:hypothetical protein n=1 Tax=unclassified Streptomyces TaxID=2593676 RepID=UPI002DDBC480|nr:MULTISPECIES: hypothetical protein [unclassified Streptomyces]MEE1792261.1 hypothetical protein [Streptomyces sp. BE308]WRZ70472.1 hypothetical protein OG251_01970 [Streptomyces sp. NBC_01237]
MFQETPIYTRLVTERGDVPTEVRTDAERIHRDLSRLFPASLPLGSGTPHYRPREQ